MEDDINLILTYFNGDDLAANVWKSKYQLKEPDGTPIDITPEDMHRRMAHEIARIEKRYEGYKSGGYHQVYGSYLSQYGKNRELLNEERIFAFFDKFRFMIPGGSTMQLLGNPYQIGSLSNCFVIGQPDDSYSGIMKLREEQVQLMKRRGGVGKDLSSLRPRGSSVKNAAKTSTGAASFMPVDSELTREVAQDGRRGALMLTMDIRHPDVLEFITMKQDLTKVTGANVSVLIRDDFMNAVSKNEDYILRYPVDFPEEDMDTTFKEILPYDTLRMWEYDPKIAGKQKVNVFAKKIKARDYWNILIKCAWNTGEPGIMFLDRHWNYSPDGVYPEHKGVTTNPCGEIFMSAYDACRLIAMNVYSFVVNPFTEDAQLDEVLAYAMFYEQVVIADDIIDLEREAIHNIMKHIRNSEEERNESNTIEFNLWERILRKMEKGRRIGCGITGLGDMIAAMGLAYGSEKSLVLVDKLMSIKLQAELDATTDLAITRSPFSSWQPELEFHDEENTKLLILRGNNDFFDTIALCYPEAAKRMRKFGRRNVSWSTVAPTGSISMLTQTTSGIEPLFSLYHVRRVKMDVKEGVSDYIDPNNGDWFKEYIVIHPKVKEWYNTLGYDTPFEQLPRDVQLKVLENTPWSHSLADDINTASRIEMQAIVQRYTTHSISSTVNLPNDVSVDTVSDLYVKAWLRNLKGITVYRDGCRAGVIVKKKEEEFEYHHAPSRGKELDANFHQITVKGEKFGVIIGLKNRRPYEIFAVRDHIKGNKFLKGKTIKIKKGSYTFFSNDGKFTYENVQCLDNIEERATTLYGSMLLRHGTPITHVIKTMKKVGDNISSFTSAITRVLSLYIPNGVVAAENCPSCGSKLVFENGCSVCKNCGESTCG